VHAVAAETGGEVGAVVEDDGDGAALRDRQDGRDGAGDLGVRRRLDADLQGGDVAGVQRTLERLDERPEVRERRRRDQVEAAGAQAAFSSAPSQRPRLARPFILARWAKARCAAGAFSTLPAQARCGACCRARP